MARRAAMSRRELEDKIVSLALRDDGFRQAFLANPRREFEAHLGKKLPPKLRITAVQEDANHLHFVIPAQPAAVKEMSDAELEQVAGGVAPAASGVLAITEAFSVTAIVATANNDKGW